MVRDAVFAIVIAIYVALGAELKRDEFRLNRFGAAARTIESIYAAIGEILGAFTPEECANYFRNSGYPT